jgi:hypothetical protein
VRERITGPYSAPARSAAILAAMSTAPHFDRLLAPIVEEIERQSLVADRFIDKEIYQIYVATVWAQFALNPEDAGISGDDLEGVHDALNRAIIPVLGAAHDVRTCFSFINSKAGEQALTRCRVPAHHRDLLLYFCSIILDPEGHRQWAEEQRRGRN